LRAIFLRKFTPRRRSGVLEQIDPQSTAVLQSEQ